jgi:hypothetical protein
MLLTKFVRLGSKNKFRNRLDQEILGSRLRVSNSQICRNINTLVAKVFQFCR